MYHGGYAGKILRIDLSEKLSKEEPVHETIVKNYLGGAGSQADLDKMLDEYYAERGWDKSGTPTPTKLRELEIKKH